RKSLAKWPRHAAGGFLADANLRKITTSCPIDQTLELMAGRVLHSPIPVRPEEEIAHLPFAAEGELADREDQLAGGLDGLEMSGHDALDPGVVDPAFQHDHGILAHELVGVRPVLILQIADAEQAAAVDLLGRVQVKSQLAGAGIRAVADRQVKHTGA